MTTPLVTALACVTVSCKHPARLVALLGDELGWDVMAEGAVDADLEALWGIAPGSAGARFTVMRAPDTTLGMIRVVQGDDRYPSRPIGARWSGLEIVVMSDVDGLHAGLDAHPDFAVFSPPQTYDFTHAGSNIHRSFLGRMPGGAHIVFTMAVTAPRRQGRIFPSARARVGQVFAAHLVAARYPESFAFYRDTLGMVPFLEDHLVQGAWHKTWSLPDGAPVELSIFRGGDPTSSQGSVEMQGYEDRYVDPVPARPDRLDGGTGMTTYTAAADIDTVFAAVESSGQATILSRPRTVRGAPYGNGRSFVFLGPSGERFEIAERFGVQPG